MKILRNFRQKMLKESKTTKYLMYAFGEIILVVVGILIALQINNWKEHKKLEILEIKMLSEVKNGLKFDLQEIEGAIKFHNSIIKSQEIAANWLQNKLSFQDSLAQHFMRATFSSNFVFKDAP
ncbi:MAG: DUF6090 family protein [Polaribacter sp.]